MLGLSDKAKKWLLVVVMSLLMVAFALPSWIGSGGGGGRDFAVGTLADGSKMMASEVELAKYEWQELMDIGIPVQVVSPMGVPETVGLPVTALLFVDGDTIGQVSMQQLEVLSQMLSEYNKRPELFAMLKREARQAGIRPNRDRVESIMVNRVSPQVQAEVRRSASIRQALVSLFAVDEMSEQAASAVKVTQPQVRTLLARGLQMLDLTAVVLEASEFESILPPVANETVQDLFARFGARPKGDPDLTANPYGFGYRQGDRVRLETIVVAKAELRRAARATRDDYDWEVEAEKYYRANRDEFKVSDLSLSATPAPTTQGTQYRSFEEVKAGIESRLIDAKADQLAVAVQRRLTTLLNADYRAYSEAVKKGQTAPASAVGPAFDTFGYLTALAGRVEQETKVRPAVTSYGDVHLDAEGLSAIEPVAMAFAETSVGRQMTLPQFLLSRAKTFFAASAGAREPGAVALENYEPTPVFRTFDGGITIARVTDARESRVPQLEEVIETVRKDAVRFGMGEAAKRVGKELAETSPELTLAEAAKAKGRTAQEIKGFSGQTMGGVLPTSLATLSPSGRQALLQQAFDLLRQPESASRARTVVHLPRDGKVVVLELQNAVLAAPSAQLGRFEVRLIQDLRADQVGPFLMSYFQRDSVNQRLGFKAIRPEETEAKTPGT